MKLFSKLFWLLILIFILIDVNGFTLPDRDTIDIVFDGDTVFTLPSRDAIDIVFDATVTNDTAPVMDSAIILPASPHTNDTLFNYCQATDPNGDPVSYNWEISINDIIYDQGDTRNVTNNSLVQDEETSNTIINGVNMANSVDQDNTTFGYSPSGAGNTANIYEYFNWPGDINSANWTFITAITGPPVFSSEDVIVRCNKTDGTWHTLFNASSLFSVTTRTVSLPSTCIDTDQLVIWTFLLSSAHSSTHSRYYEGIAFFNYSNQSFFNSGVSVNVRDISSIDTTFGDNFTLSCKAFDGTEFSSFLNSTTITILNSFPLFNESLVNVSISHSQIYNYTYNWSDLDQHNVSITVNISGMDATVHNDTHNFELYWESNLTVVGNHNGEVIITDGFNSSSTFFYVNITNSLSLDDVCGQIDIFHNQNLNCTFNATDSDGDILVWETNESRISINSNGTVFDNPVLSDYNIPSCWNVSVNVTDTVIALNSSFLYCINNTAPIINDTLLNVTIAHTSVYNFTYNWSDFENDVVNVTVNITDMSVIVNNNTYTFQLYWEPTSGDLGTHEGTIIINDSILATSYIQAFSVTIIYDLSGEINLELGSLTNISSGNTSSFCIDIDHPEFGVNYSCGTGQIDIPFNITYFRQTNFTGNSSVIGTSNETILIPAHQYDEVVGFTLNVSGIESDGSYPENVEFYINDTLVLTEVLISSAPETNTTLTQFTNNKSFNELTFTQNEIQIAYIKLPKLANVTFATMNITGIDTEYEISNPEDTLGSPNYVVGYPTGFNVVQNFTTAEKITGITVAGSGAKCLGNYPNLTIALWNGANLIEEEIKEDTSYDTGIDITWYLTTPYATSAGEILSVRTNSSFCLFSVSGYDYVTYWVDKTHVYLGSPENDGDVIDTQWQIILGQTNMTNGTIDVGTLDGSFEWNYTGAFGITEQVSDFSSVLNSYLAICTSDDDGNCDVSIYVSSDTAGVANLTNLNITYHFTTAQGDIKNLSSDAIQSFLSASTGATNIPIRIYNPGNGTILLSDIRYDYAGGNDTINISVHGDSINNYTYNLNVIYSAWNYSFPNYVDYLEFIPAKPTSQNVEPYGQTSTRPIFNITNFAYSNFTSNYSMYLNETFSCVNLSINTVYNSSTATQLDTSWTDLFGNNYLESNTFFMWADYSCNVTAWNNWFPDLYLRACSDNSTCSEDIV